MAAYETAGSIVSDVAVEVGLGVVSDAWASTDANVVQLRTLLKSVGRGLVAQHAWLQQRKEHTFTTSTASTYSLPADFLSMVEQSGWNRSSRLPLVPATPQEWQYLQATDVGVVLSLAFRPRDGLLEVWPQPPASGETVAFEYLSRHWVDTDADDVADADAPSANADVVRLESNLVSRGLKLAFLRAKGFDSTAAQVEYEAAFGAAASASATAAPVLQIGGSRTSERHLNGGNAPATGFGLDGDGGLF